MNSYYTDSELRRIGFLKVGACVKISRKASFYRPESILINDYVRIDDFCILSGKITIDSYVHIAAYSALFGGTVGIDIGKYSNISSRVCIYALSDDYSGKTMTNPMIPDRFKAVLQKRVSIEDNVIIGTGSTILPGVTLSQGTAIGAMSLVKSSTKPWMIYAGIPVKVVKKRSKDLLKLELLFEKDIND